jgi:pimeloyl-ACP methyl ester carboxylesterase
MSSFHELPDGATLAYDDLGSGRPVVLIHGVSMSRRFFERNTGPLSEQFRVINVDLRGHGESPGCEGNHTVAQYARDVKHLIDGLGLQRPVLVGWSMGTFVIWDLIKQFGADGLAGHVNVSQGPTDLQKEDWELGVFPVAAMYETLAAAQSDFRGTMAHFVPAMLADEPSAEDLAFMIGETQRVGANAGTCILLDQCLVDYRDFVGTYDLPTLVCFGRDEKLIKFGNAAWIAEQQPGAEVAVFESSGHCPMWEEPDRFNTTVSDWIARLP